MNATPLTRLRLTDGICTRVQARRNSAGVKISAFFPLDEVAAWLTADEVAEVYGRFRKETAAWLDGLRADGRVRTMDAPCAPNGKGKTRYFLPDVEAAALENANGREMKS
ncbi:MAG: hypothetical protein Q4E43_07845 [Akkermansia sp.]|nr:hypothetical protein [Akkermansia sp.]